MSRLHKAVNAGIHRSNIYFYLFMTLSVILCLFSGSCTANAQASFSGQAQKPFVEGANFNPAVPTPQSVTGYAVAEKAVRYDALVRYLQALAKASDRVTLTDYGLTYEGRTLYYVTITSEANHKRLEKIKADNAKLSDPRTLQGAEKANQLIANLPAVAWMNYSIHGDELSSTDAAMYVAYHLAASEDETNRKLLDRLVVHITPLVNPDGRERYLSHLEQLTGVVSSPDYQSMQHQALWSRGRGNHYLFDLNRDWLVHIHPEVRALAEVILSWNPHLLVDSHEQGAYDTYLFDPPQEPLNIHLSPKLLEWRRRFGADHAEAFNRYGWSYYTKDWYSEWSPIYTNAWANVQGAVGLLYEQARVNAASIKHPTGEQISFRQTVHHHIVSSLTNLRTLGDNRRQIINDFVEDRLWAIDADEPHGGIFLLPPGKDTSRCKRLVELLERQGIEFKFAQGPFEALKVTDIWASKFPGRKFPKGTLIARSKQPRRRMLHTLCEFDVHLADSFLLKERKELENHRDTLLYDVTSWSLPMAFALESYWAESISDVEFSSAPAEPVSSKLNSKSSYGYLLDFENSSVYSALVRLFDNGCHPRVAIKEFQFKSRKYLPGTVLLRGHENPDNLLEILQTITSDFDIEIKAADTALSEDGPDLGGGKFELLTAPKVAIASQWPIRSTSFGSLWYLLDYRLGLQCSPLNIQSISRIDLRKYNCLILPDCRDLGRVLDAEAVKKIKRWVENGGTLIAVGGSAVFASGKDRGLSSVRLKRDVLDKLDEYAEAVERETNARNIKIDPNLLWTTKTPRDKPAETQKDQTKKPESSKDKPDTEKLKRTDEWQRIFSPRGTFLAGIVNTEHWLGFGLRRSTPVMFSGSSAFMSKHPTATVVRLADKDKLRLSGLLWPEAKQRLADTAFATVESMGQGQLILFANDPAYRMWLAAEQRLILNAILLGPGMGTSQPVPW